MDCSAGYYSTGGADSCTPCDAGKFASSAGKFGSCLLGCVDEIVFFLMFE